MGAGGSTNKKKGKAQGNGADSVEAVMTKTAEKVAAADSHVGLDTSKQQAALKAQALLDEEDGQPKKKGAATMDDAKPVRKMNQSFTVALHQESAKIERKVNRSNTISGATGFAVRGAMDIDFTEEIKAALAEKQQKMTANIKSRQRRGSATALQFVWAPDDKIKEQMDEACKAWIHGRNPRNNEPVIKGKERVVIYNGCDEAYFDSKGIAFSCLKGCKGDNDTTPNQDNFFISHAKDGWEVYCVMDGHGPHGHQVSERCVKTLPYFMMQHEKWGSDKFEDIKEMCEKAFDQCQNDLIAFASLQTKADENFDVQASGTTCIVGLRKGDKLYTAHTGDSRLIVGYLKEKKGRVHVETDDHKPDVPENGKNPEVTRIEMCGGEVRTFRYDDDWSVSRIFIKGEDYPGLCMTRSLGDVCVKEHGVTAKPEVKEHVLKLDDCPYIFLASDGVWEFLDSAWVSKTCHKRILGCSGSKTLQDHCIKKLTKESRKKWREEEGDYCDDITGIVLCLDPQNKYKGSKHDKDDD